MDTIIKYNVVSLSLFMLHRFLLNIMTKTKEVIEVNDKIVGIHIIF